MEQSVFEIFEAFLGGAVNGGQVKEGNEKSSSGREEEETGDVELGRDIKSDAAKEVHDESLDCEVFGDGMESMKDVWFVETEDFEGEDFMVDGRG